MSQNEFARDKTQILIVNVMGTYSLGARAVIKGAIRSLSENIPNAKLTLMSSHYETERDLYKKWNYENVELIDHIWYHERDSLLLTLIHSGICASWAYLHFGLHKYLKGILPLDSKYKNYDIIIDLTTDGPNEHYGLFMFFFSIFNTQLALMSGKPVAICAASIGKFEKPITKLLAKHVLNKANLITVREEITGSYLSSFGISNPEIYLTADHAFLMQPAAEDRINEIFAVEKIGKYEKPTVGISPSRLIHKYAFPNIVDKKDKYQEYVNVMLKIIEYINDTIDCSILLIPHSGAASAMTPDEDDRAISREIFELAKNKYKLEIIEGDYDAHELKGIIGRCDMFIGCRMHATIASTSMSVPTISVVYGHKSHGIIGKMMGQEELIVEIEKFNSEEYLSVMKSKIDYLYANKEDIRRELAKRAKIAENKALLNGQYIKELLEKNTVSF